MSAEVRARVLQEMGVSFLYELAFDRDMSLRDDRAFATEVLSEGLGAAHVAVGFDYRFGRERVGDAASLTRWGEELGFGVSVVEQVSGNGGKYSSSALRAALREGDVETAERMLARPWIVDGLVERGDQRGRLLGFPTANVSLGALLRPKLGVYAIEARIEDSGALHPGVANIGRRPTFEGERELLEAHLFEFDGDLYGQRIEVHIRTFLRAERSFSGVDELTEQIARDVTAAKAALTAANTRPPSG